jgi:hypothetical protein
MTQRCSQPIRKYIIYSQGCFKTTQTKAKILTPYAGIKSVSATLPDEIFTGDFSSLTVHFVNTSVKNQQMQQLFIQFINYVW